MRRLDIALEPVRSFIEDARWFGGKGRTWRLDGVRRLGTLPHDPDSPEDDPGLQVVIDLAEVTYDDGAREREAYQLPLACYPDGQHRLGHALLGEWEDPELGLVHVHDAVHDRVAMQRWLRAFAGLDAARPTGDLTFHRLPGHDLELDSHSTLFSGEQSNSSVRFGEDSLMKVFRKVTPGDNPDVTIHRVLTEAGSEHVAALYGWVEAREGEEIYDLAMLQQFLRTASDGWDLALVSVRNLFAEADLHAEEVGGDFAGEAARLGTALAETHATLATHFPTAVLTAPEVAALADRMGARLDEALGIVPDLAEHADRLRAAYSRLSGLREIPVQTVHGDLHLGQTLRTARGWKIVDFEGEPARPLAERQAPDSPWRDVAGMLRSFDYAPQVVAHTSYPESDDDPDQSAAQRAYRAAEWSRRNRAAFLEAYAEARGPALGADDRVLLDAHVADKAVYEAVYEARNRPAWVDIPLRALTEVAAP